MNRLKIKITDVCLAWHKGGELTKQKDKKGGILESIESALLGTYCFLIMFPAMLLQHMLCKLIGKKSWLEISQENFDEYV